MRQRFGPADGSGDQVRVVQAGKTTLMRRVLDDLPYRCLAINADELRYTDVLSSRDRRRLRGLVEGDALLFIDEAQRIPEIGLNLKLLVDHLPDLRIVVTGSSSFRLNAVASKVQEPLTGRAWVHRLYPIAMSELARLHNPFELDDMLEERLVYGSYPEIFALAGDVQRREYLHNLAASYLYRDVLEIGGVRHSNKLRNLVRLLAFQIGREVFADRARQPVADEQGDGRHLHRSPGTVVRPLSLGRVQPQPAQRGEQAGQDLLLGPGVRNAAIDNLKPLTERDDVGALWENFVLAERLKWLHHHQTLASLYFWRTYTGAEIDIVEEREGGIHAYECKWSRPSPARPLPESFLAAYPGASFEVITRESYRAHLGA